MVRVSGGAGAGTAVSEYAHGVIERELPGYGREVPPDWALQDPGDYTSALRAAVPAARRPGASTCLPGLDPRFASFAAGKLARPISPLGSLVGRLKPTAAALTGLPAGIAVGNVDAHVTVPAAGPGDTGARWSRS